jgi:hypothetical protein
MTGRDPIIDMQPCTEAEFMARLNGYAERFPEIAAWGTGARASYESAQLLEGAVHRSRIMTKRLLRQKPCRRFTRRKVNSGLPRASTRCSLASGKEEFLLEPLSERRPASNRNRWPD